MAYLELQRLTKEFGSLRAVDAIDLRVDRGDIYVLLGPNGAGKTTTLRMLAGIIPPTSGEVVVDGLNLGTNPTDVKSRFFFIPDRPYMYEKLTGREYMEFLINIYRRGSVQSVQPLLSEFDLASRIEHLIESYSHGMRQKLLLTAAFMLEPPLLIVDEPMVGLDPKSAAVWRRKLMEYVQSNRLALISTHQLTLAEQIASRVGILHRGRMLAEGPPATIMHQAKSGTLEEAFLELTLEPDLTADSDGK